jgi:hypothetical protein
MKIFNTLFLSVAYIFSLPAQAQLTGETRKDYIEQTVKSCYSAQRNAAQNKDYSDKVLTNYCTCYATHIADAFNEKIVLEFSNGTRPMSGLDKYTRDASQFCAKQITK